MKRRATRFGIRGRAAVVAALVCALAAAPPGAEIPSRFDALLAARAAPGHARIGNVAVCFAPGTPASYVERLTRQGSLGGGAKAAQPFESFRWNRTATDGFGLVLGDPTTLTWSIVPDGTTVPGNDGASAAPSNLRAYLDGIHGDESGWRPLLARVFGRWGDLTGVTYVYEPEDDGSRLSSAQGRLGVRGDIRIGGRRIDGDFGVLAYNSFPNDGDMVIDTSDSFFHDTTQSSRRLRNVVAHEHGHGLALDHVCPINRTKLMEPNLSTSFDGPQQDDILGAQRLYGDPYEPNDGAGGAEDLGDPGSREVTVSNASIDDETDADWYVFTAAEGTFADVTVRPVGRTYREGPQNAGGSCGPQPLIDTSRLVDLRVTLFRPDRTEIVTADETGYGETEELLDVPLPAGAGRYFVRVRGSPDNEPQLYELTLTLAQRGSKPLATDDVAETWEVLPVSTAVLENDIGLEDEPIRVRLVEPPPVGKVKLVGRDFVYVPPRGFTGEERYTYEVRDLHGQVATAEVAVTVQASALAGKARVDGDGDGYSDELETRLGSAPGDAASRPGVDIADGAPPLTVGNLVMLLNNRRELADGVRLRGRVDVTEGFDPEGARVVVDVAGVLFAFTLDRRGRATANGDDPFGHDGAARFRLRVKRRRRRVLPGSTRFDAAFRRGDYATAWKDEGLDTSRRQRREARAATVVVIVGNETLRQTVPLVYSARTGRIGTARSVR